jgi:GWxTD domain-containing protein
MHLNSYGPSSIQYQGIEYDQETLVRQSQRRLLQQGSVFIEFKFPQQKRGNYRFEVTSDKEESELFKARDFGVKSPNYPAVKTALELARPLAYLMGDDEYKEMMAISEPDSLKQAIDRFWLREIGNKNEAINVIKLYYQRIEEANKQFSNFKEGWKTDTGLAYVLFGPPVYVNRRGRNMRWVYSNNLVNDRRSFQFGQPTFRSDSFPFTHFILNRSQSLYQVQYQQKELWLTGLILQRRK